jgi:hypothetical protein
MASTNNVIFPESMADILANPVDICFDSMSAKSTTPAACLIIECNTVTADQQIRTDLWMETHPPTPSDLIAGIDRVEGLLSDTIKVCERVKHPCRTSSSSSMPLGLHNAAHVAFRYMKRKIQIESGPKTPDHGNRRSHLDEPCPIHENPKHTTPQCHVLKKLRQPLTAAYRRQMNREPSPDRLAFQIARTTISPIYQGEGLEILDHEILVDSTDVPTQDLETDEQCQECENANAKRVVHRQQELAAAAPAVGKQPVNTGQVNDNVGQQEPVAPATPQPRQQGNESRENRLRTKDLQGDFERDVLEVYNSPQTNMGAALAALNLLEDSPVVRCLQANVRVITAHIEERGPRYSRSEASSYSRSKLERPRQRCRSKGPLEPVAEDGRGENKVI